MEKEIYVYNGIAYESYFDAMKEKVKNNDREGHITFMQLVLHK